MPRTEQKRNRDCSQIKCEMGNIESKGEFYETNNRKQTEDGYELNSNTFKTHFHQHATDGKIFEIEQDMCRVGFISQEAAANGGCELEDRSCDGEGAGDSCKVILRNVKRGTDNEFVVDTESVQGNIIVKEKCDQYEYDFELSLFNLETGVSDDGKRLELRRRDTGNVQFDILAPLMTDADGNESDSAYYEIVQETEDRLSLKVIADKDWMEAEDRSFPVKITAKIGVANYRGVYYTDQAYYDSIFRYETMEITMATNAYKVIGHELRIAYDSAYENGFRGIDSDLTIMKNKIPQRTIDHLQSAILKLTIAEGSKVDGEFCVGSQMCSGYNGTTNREVYVDITPQFLNSANKVQIRLSNNYGKGGYSIDKDIRFEVPLLILRYTNHVTELFVTSPPLKMDYIAGEKFETDGMQVNARYADGSIEPITNYQIVPSGSLATYDEYVTIVYKDDESNDSEVSVKFYINMDQDGFNDRRPLDGMENVYRVRLFDLAKRETIGEDRFIQLELCDGIQQGDPRTGTPLDAYHLNHLKVRAENIIGEIKEENLPEKYRK